MGRVMLAADLRANAWRHAAHYGRIAKLPTGRSIELDEQPAHRRRQKTCIERVSERPCRDECARGVPSVRGEQRTTPAKERRIAWRDVVAAVLARDETGEFRSALRMNGCASSHDGLRKQLVVLQALAQRRIDIMQLLSRRVSARRAQDASRERS